jgi:glycosyltransferase involved in cell wall biosynthesis
LRLIFLTQVVDADHPALAQTIDLIDALARRCRHVTVLCDRVGRHTLPGNVTLRTFGTASRFARGAAFERLLGTEIVHRETRPDAVLSHMIPLFLLLAAPVCKAYRIPLALWYTHSNADRSLRMATRVADVVFSVDRRSFPLESPKVRGIGHAIDVTQFAAPAAPGAATRRLRFLGLGRMTPWKGFTTILRGFELALEQGLDAELEIRGPTLTGAEQAHLQELRAIVGASAALGKRVRLEGPVARERIPALLGEAHALLSATQPSLDKVVYEAAAAGIPVVSSNVVLDDFLGGLPLRLRFRRRDPEDLAGTLLALAAAGPEVRWEVGQALRSRVESGHSLESWADAVMGELTAIRSGRGRSEG